MDLGETVAIVTGGASGLGAATVREIVARGGKVLIADLNEELGAALAAELGPSALFQRTDVSDEASVTAAVEAASTLGALSASVNCAGIAIAQRTVGRDGPHNFEDYQRVLSINLAGSFNVGRLAAARMARNAPNADGERGVIIHTASIAAFDGQKGQPAYASSKGGVVGMTLPMARDLASLGVRVNSIAPGLFLTPMVASLPEPAQAALAEEPLFPKRLGDPREFAALACFIISCPYLNGETIRIDGGVRLP